MTIKPYETIKLKDKPSPWESAEVSNSVSNVLLSASSVIMWLDDEIDRLEYPVGSLDIDRNDRNALAKCARKARAQIRKLQDIGR